MGQGRVEVAYVGTAKKAVARAVVKHKFFGHGFIMGNDQRFIGN